MDHVWESNPSLTPPATPVAPAPGYPTETGTPTVPGQWWFHMITEEIRNALILGGLTPSYSNLSQLGTAIQNLALGAANTEASARATADAGLQNQITVLGNRPVLIVDGAASNIVLNTTTATRIFAGSTETVDSANAFDSSTGIFTAPKTGIVLFSGVISLSVSASNQARVYHRWNGAAGADVALLSSGSATYVKQSFAVTLDLAAGNTVDFFGVLSSAGSDNIKGMNLSAVYLT